ncbi:3-phosphoglycerate kinase [Handroanthus impetiginosus]|uniref:Phosphoglycerate kinase n=1 Tax=Handroanthus impetiginosus TaxID=429701 RepID=A0A2G9GH53_9LAMI|nr:3-phosphoglycerate kinase [Handroanthus impetiginosus]
MNQVLDFSRGNQLINSLNRHVFPFNSPRIPPRKACFPFRNRSAFRAFRKMKCSGHLFSCRVSCKLVDQTEHSLVEKDAVSDGEQFTTFPHIQTLRNFPKEKLFRKVVMVRFDTMIILQGMKEHQSSPENAFSTIKYLYEAGAKVILVGSWSENANSRFSSEACPSTESVSDFLSLMLEVKIVPVKYDLRYTHSDVDVSKKSGILLLENLFYLKGERANCSKFSKELTSGVDMVVNDAFSESHKVLASTVGIASFCSDYIAGFYFEECLHKLEKIMKTDKRPYVAIIGGGNLADKAAALRFLSFTCDGLIFVGSMAFHIMHALGLPVPMKLVEGGALKEAVSIVESAKSRNIPLVIPKDIRCIKNDNPKQMDVFSVYSIPEGWQPIDIGPISLQEMTDLLSKCKKIIWIGPFRFSSSKQDKGGTFKLAEALGNLSSCDITFVGKVEFEEALGKSKSFSSDNFVKSASVVWEVLKGRKLPGLMALDRAYPFQVDWSAAYDDPMRPLVVDVGSGNGLFLFGMARRRKDMNCLGLEINEKLVDRCLDDICRLAIHNVHFIATNATSTFRSIVSSYPGQLVLVSIQCPNPDFNKPEYRWRMLQRSLVEAIADMLIIGGKVFLQSDIEAVALRMKNEFIEYSNGKLIVMEHSDDLATNKAGWLKENPFGVPSDWEKHVLDRGDPMYRLLLSKVDSRGGSK